MEKNRGQLIGEKIRKLSLNLDLKIAYAGAQLKSANESYKLFSKLEGNDNKRKALDSKIMIVCYRMYLKNLKDAKKDLMSNIERILNRYYQNYKIIWIKYFINEESIESIAAITNKSQDQIVAIIEKFKNDLANMYTKEDEKKLESGELQNYDWSSICEKCKQQKRIKDCSQCKQSNSCKIYKMMIIGKEINKNGI